MLRVVVEIDFHPRKQFLHRLHHAESELDVAPGCEPRQLDMGYIVIIKVELKALGRLPFDRKFIVVLYTILGIIGVDEQRSGITGFFH